MTGVGLGGAILLLLGPLLPFHHDSSQNAVHARLVAGAFELEPVQHFDIHAKRDFPLSRPVPARLRACFPITEQYVGIKPAAARL